MWTPAPRWHSIAWDACDHGYTTERQDIHYRLTGQPGKSEERAAGALDKTAAPARNRLRESRLSNGSFFSKVPLDEVIVVNRALSAAEIAALYALQTQQPSSPTALIADYPFSGNALDRTF
jgi:hypothetical protein